MEKWKPAIEKWKLRFLKALSVATGRNRRFQQTQVFQQIFVCLPIYTLMTSTRLCDSTSSVCLMFITLFVMSDTSIGKTIPLHMHTSDLFLFFVDVIDIKWWTARSRRKSVSSAFPCYTWWELPLRFIRWMIIDESLTYALWKMFIFLVSFSRRSTYSKCNLGINWETVQYGTGPN